MEGVYLAQPDQSKKERIFMGPVKVGGIGALVAAAVAVTLAVATGSAVAAPQTTLGSTSGTPSANICVATINCTYVPFSNASTPGLKVPFNGTVTSFSVNAGSAGGAVRLRVLRPAGGGKYTGVGTSSAQTLKLGVNNFTASLPVKAGDVLGLDNDSSALMFDPGSTGSVTDYYELPSLADGATAAPNRTQTNYRLLLSATVAASPPTITGAAQNHRRWRLGSKLAKFAAAAKPPIGTTFWFTLDEAATVRFAFAQLLPGRRLHGKCVAQTAANRTHKACTRGVPRGALSFSASAGFHRLFFQGRLTRTRKLKPSTYRLTITATNAAGQRATKTLRPFTVIP